MNIDYCSNCGCKMEYGLHKPNFCPQCGTQVSTGATILPQKIDAGQGRAASASVDERPVESVARLSKLAYEVDYGGMGIKKQTIGDLMQSEIENGNSKPPKKLKKTREPDAPEGPSPDISAENSLKQKLDVVKESIAQCSSSANKFRDAEEDVV